MLGHVAFPDKLDATLRAWLLTRFGQATGGEYRPEVDRRTNTLPENDIHRPLIAATRWRFVARRVDSS